MSKRLRHDVYIVWPLEIVFLILHQLYRRLEDEKSFAYLRRTRAVSTKVRELIDQRLIPVIEYLGPAASDAIYVHYSSEMLTLFDKIPSLKLGSLHAHVLRAGCFTALRSLSTPDSRRLGQKLPTMTTLTSLSVEKPDSVGFNGLGQLTTLPKLCKLRLTSVNWFPRLHALTGLVKLKVNYRQCVCLPTWND
jgi:hypothetical protein